MKLLFSTNNQAKLTEVSDLGKQLGFEVLSLADVGLAIDPEETGNTFEENARIKLNAALGSINDTDLWVAAEDAGLEIDYLNGEPGVHTKRWSGSDMSDQEIVDFTLQKLKDVPYNQRQAKFSSVVALAYANNPTRVGIHSGAIEGRILQKPDLTQPLEGLPFRQLFFVTQTGRMLGDTTDLSPAESALILTHRQQAFKKAFNYIKDIQSLN